MRALTNDEIQATRRTALSSAEESRRPLREAREAGMQDDPRFLVTECYLSNGQVTALATAIQQLWDGTTDHLTQSWWVGVGGSWGEQVLGPNPVNASPEAWKMAQMILEPVWAEFHRWERADLLQALDTFNEKRVVGMGIGTSPARPTRPCGRDRREIAR